MALTYILAISSTLYSNTAAYLVVTAEILRVLLIITRLQ
jgi:hypothetical protein